MTLPSEIKRKLNTIKQNSNNEHYKFVEKCCNAIFIDGNTIGISNFDANSLIKRYPEIIEHRAVRPNIYLELMDKLIFSKESL